MCVFPNTQAFYPVGKHIEVNIKDWLVSEGNAVVSRLMRQLKFSRVYAVSSTLRTPIMMFTWGAFHCDPRRLIHLFLFVCLF